MNKFTLLLVIISFNLASQAQLSSNTNKDKLESSVESPYSSVPYWGRKATPGCLRDSTFSYGSVANSAWFITGKTIFIYSPNSLLIRAESYFTNQATQSWTIAYRYVYNYDAQNHLVEVQRETRQSSFSGPYWLPNDRYTYTVDASGNVTNSTFEQYDNLSSSWYCVSGADYTYDSNNLRLTFLYKKCYLNTWTNMSLKSYTYDANQHLTSSLHQFWPTNTNTLTNNSLQTNYVYAGNNLLSYITKKWNSNSNTWVNYNNTTNTYSGNNLVQELIESTNGTGWVNSRLTSYTYTPSDSLAQMLVQVWYTTTNKWNNLDLYNYAYYSNQFQSQYLYKSWNRNTSVWENMLRYDYFYDCSKLGIENNSLSVSNLFPQPADTQVQINLPGYEGSIFIWDAGGQLLQSLPMNESLSLNTTHYPPGIYVISFSAKNGAVIRPQKLLVAR